MAMLDQWIYPQKSGIFPSKDPFPFTLLCPYLTTNQLLLYINSSGQNTIYKTFLLSYLRFLIPYSSPPIIETHGQYFQHLV